MKVTIHPLFFAVIIFSAFTGGFFECIIFALTALLHECGHIFCAARLGFKCERIKLMPYGAASVCDLDGIRRRDEISLALAGPFVNAVICVICAGLWWFYPETYAYTDTVMAASLVMLAVNLLPAYPLDGGRVLCCVLTKILSQRAAGITLRVINCLIAATFFILFFFTGFNLTFIFFSLFLICSAFEKPPQTVKINFSSRDKLKRGMEVKYVLVDASFTYKDALRYLDDKTYLVLQLYDGGVADEITQDELYESLTFHTIYDRVFDG
ncbi:MAG: site-2 protease family protein [Candidatus Coproplasma sp.]